MAVKCSRMADASAGVVHSEGFSPKADKLAIKVMSWSTPHSTHSLNRKLGSASMRLWNPSLAPESTLQGIHQHAHLVRISAFQVSLALAQTTHERQTGGFQVPFLAPKFQGLGNWPWREKHPEDLLENSLDILLEWDLPRFNKLYLHLMGEFRVRSTSSLSRTGSPDKSF